MRRWHSETVLMRKRMALARVDHNQWRDLFGPKPCDCGMCTSDGIGWFRDRHPRDCGRAKCGCCHPHKGVPKARASKRRRAIDFELSL